MLFQVQIQPKSFKSVSVYGNCGETTQAHYMTKLYNWLMHDVIIIIIIIIGCLGGGVDKTIREVRRIFENDELAKQIVGTMQKTVLMDSETTLRKIFSGLIQLEES